MSDVLNLTYYDICRQIELLTLKAIDLEKDIERLRRMLLQSRAKVKLVASYSVMPAANYVSRPFDELWADKRQLEQQLEGIISIIEQKKEVKRKMEEVMEKCDALEYRVAYLRDVKRKPLYEIADELGYTYNWIREVSARVKRMRQPTTNTQTA